MIGIESAISRYPSPPVSVNVAFKSTTKFLTTGDKSYTNPSLLDSIINSLSTNDTVYSIDNPKSNNLESIAFFKFWITTNGSLSYANSVRGFVTVVTQVNLYLLPVNVSST